MKRVKFSALAIAVFVIVTSITYAPVWLGKVPLPANVLYYFAAYQDSSNPKHFQPVANIGDLITSFYQFRHLAGQAARRGILPLWNPYILSGVPFLGHSQTALFYPPNILFYVLPLPLAWTASLLLREILAGLSMVLLIRSLGGTKGGAILSGIIFSGCGVITAWQGYSRGDTAIWLPLVCYGVVLLRKQLSMRTIGFTAVAFTVPVLAGHPQTAVHITMVGSALAVILWAWPADRADRAFDVRFLLLFGMAGALALGLSAIQLLPTAEFLHQMRSVFELAWPTYSIYQGLGLVSRDVLRSPNSAGIAIPEAASYVGMISLLLCSLAPFFKNRRYVVFFGVITVLAFAIAYSIPPMPWIVSHTPLRALKNFRLNLIGSFGIAVLAGLGLSALEEESTPFKGKRNRALISVAIAFVFAFAMVYTLQQHTAMKVEFMRRPSFSRALLLIGLLPIVLRLIGRFRMTAFSGVVCVIAAFDLVTFGMGYTGYSRPSEIFPNTSVFDFLRRQGSSDQFRIAQLGGPYPVNSPVLYELSSADGYELLTDRERNFVRGLTEDFGNSVNMTAAGIAKLQDRRIDMLNIKYFVLGDGSEDFKFLSMHPEQYALRFTNSRVAVFENRTVLSRAFAAPASGIEVIGDSARSLERVKEPSFDPLRNVVLSSMALADVAPRRTGEAFHYGVQIKSSDVNGYHFAVDVSQPAVLVVSQSYYPGWKARVDGVDTEVYPADYGLTGILLPAGNHEVDLRMEPGTLRAGAWITLVSTVVLLFCFMSRGAMRSNVLEMNRNERFPQF